MNNVIIAGDHHGDWNSFMKKVVSANLHDCTIISAGDNGEGFKAQHYDENYKDDYYALYNQLNEELAYRGIQFYSIRGNHTDPTFYSGDTRVALSNFEFLEDYTYKEINGQTFLFVGGAYSIDRLDRKYLDKKNGTICYWRDEPFVLDKSKLQDRPVDVLVTHSGPTWLGPGCKTPFIKSLSIDDKELMSDLLRERDLHNQLFELVKPRNWYMGHFHRSEINIYQGCKGRILDILEFFEHRP